MKTYQSNCCQQYDDSGSVVQTEDMIVDAGQVPFVEQSGNTAENEGEHFPGFLTDPLLTNFCPWN